MSVEETHDDNSSDAPEPRPAAASRLGKEATIGVTVIVVLVIGLGVAVGVRLKKSSAGDKLTATAASQSGAEKLKGPSTTDALLKETKDRYFGSSSPTLVSAKAASAQPPKTTVGDVDQWKLASERDESKLAHSGRSMPSAPPSFMPDPPKPAHADRAEPHAFAPPAATDRQPRLLEASAAKALADAKPLRAAEGNVQQVAPSDESIRPVSGQGPALTNVSGPAMASVPPAVSPSRASVPAEPAPPPQPPASLSASPSNSAGVPGGAALMPVAQLTADDYRREPATPQYSSEPRRPAAPSYNPPARRDDGKYEVQPNDNYWTISQKLYGTPAYFKALAHHNQNHGTEDDRLKPGELILAPPLAELEKSYPGLCPRASRREAQQSQSQSRVSAVGLRGSGRGGRTYTVVEGDTLFNIARNELGKASRWAEIYDLNREVLGKDFNYLTPGTQLSLPEAPKTDVIAQPPSESYRR